MTYPQTSFPHSSMNPTIRHAHDANYHTCASSTSRRRQNQSCSHSPPPRFPHAVWPACCIAFPRYNPLSHFVRVTNYIQPTAGFRIPLLKLFNLHPRFQMTQKLTHPLYSSLCFLLPKPRHHDHPQILREVATGQVQPCHRVRQ